MVINGKDRHFAFTVKAYKAVSRLCRNNDLSNITELFEGGSADSMENMGQLALILNDAYISAMRLQGIDAEDERLTTDELDGMALPEWATLSAEINVAMTEQGEIQLADSKKNAIVEG